MPESPVIDQGTPSRKGKERQAPQPTNLAEKLVAFQRKQAHLTRPKEKAERTHVSSTSTSRASGRPPSPRRLRAPPIPNPNIIVSQPSPQADAGPDEQEFTRRLKISPSSPRSSKVEHGSPRAAGRLYNPNSELARRAPITTEPDAMSDAASSSYAPRGGPPIPRAHHRSQPARTAGDAPRLFDPRKDNPFSVLTRPNGNSGGSPSIGRPTPTPKSSGDWVSASSTSSASYAHSTISSNFTLSSTTTDSSTSSALFDSAPPRSEDSTGPSALSIQLKRLYRDILHLENRVTGEDRDRDGQDDAERDVQRVGVLMKANGVANEVKRLDEETEKERWRKAVADHKELAETVHRMLSLTLAPTVPASLRNIPVKYNLVTRLWTLAFHRLLEQLRRAATQMPSPSLIALEYLQEFIYYAYTFYTGLVEEANLACFRGGWVESLGDIARYRMAVTSVVESNVIKTGSLPVNAITRAALSSTHLSVGPSTPDTSALSDKNASPTPAGSPSPARIDDSPPPSVGYEPQQFGNLANVPSVGIVAARLMVLEPEKERWRQISREWYFKGLALTPGAGKLHHHLGILSRDTDLGEKEELRAVYHFSKSMITIHPFMTSREAILGIWSDSTLTRRQAPDASLTELFVHLQGMIFTNIQLDDFKGMLARFAEKLSIEGGEVSERDWIMMATINIASILEYGRDNATLRRVAGIGGREPISGTSVSPVMTNGSGKVKLMVAKKPDSDDRKMDVDDDQGTFNALRAMAISHPSPTFSEAASAEPDIPVALKFALQLTFAIFSHTLANPIRPSVRSTGHSVNPYITIMLTFLATILKDKTAERVLARTIPWEALAAFFTTLSRRVTHREHQRESTVLLSSGTSPLPEDWCMRGLGWGGKRIYERGFWDKATGGEEKNLETEVLDNAESRGEITDGLIEEDEEDQAKPRNQAKPRVDGSPELHGRFVRIARAAFKIAKSVHGFVYIPPTAKEDRGEWKVEGILADKVARWREEDRRDKEEEERRLRGTRWVDDDSMDVDDDEGTGDLSGSSEEDEEDSEEVQTLKARRRYLQSLLQSAPGSPTSPTRRRPRGPSAAKAGLPRLRVLPGYTTLVIDTNILLSSLPMLSSLVESLQWTIVVPLPVIMELDGLSANTGPLGEAAAAANAYITSHVRSHTLSLKIQTSKGNYLPNLNLRTEQVDFYDSGSWERNMDDLILRAAIWQSEHWVDRSGFLNTNDEMRDTTGASKVVLCSFDRMLRLKARSREVDAANEQDLASILARRP